MKKIIYGFVLTIFCLFPINVFASGNISVSPSSLTIEEGSSKTFTILAVNTIGDVTIVSSNSGVASVSASEWGTGMVEEKQTKSGTITVTGKSIGSAMITLTLDAATFDGEDLAGQIRTVSVNVIEKPAPQPEPKPNNNNSGGNSSNNDSVKDNRSDNNKIKEISIDGYKLDKVDDNNYTLTVNNKIDSITIKATGEDKKAKIEGTGKHDLKVGENKIEIIVTSEKGTQNKINIKVTRKDGYHLEDIDDAVKDRDNMVTVILNKDDKISKEVVEKVKSSRKEMSFNYYDDSKKLIYSWTLDGKKISDSMDINPLVTFDSEDKDELKKLVNYSEGIIVNFAHSGKLPKGTTVKLYVGDKYKDNTLVNVYYYNKEINDIENIKNNITVKNGYIEFSIEHASEYYVTLAVLSGNNVTKDDSSSKNNNKLFTIIIIVISILLLLAIGYIIYDKVIKKNRKDDSLKETIIKEENISQNKENDFEYSDDIPIENNIYQSEIKNDIPIKNASDNFNEVNNVNTNQNINTANVETNWFNTNGISNQNMNNTNVETNWFNANSNDNINNQNMSNNNNL